MIGGGNRIGRPPGVPAAPKVEPPPAPRGAGDPAPRSADSFERSRTPFERTLAVGEGRTREPTPADLFKLGRGNPAAALRIAAGLGAQARATLAEIERELAAARGLLEKLAAERFSRSAREKVARELTRRRDRLAALKGSLHASGRKMELLRRIAGEVENPALEEEIDRIVADHAQLKTDWGRRHHLLSLGERLFGAHEDAPAHLREVVHAEVPPAGRAAGDTLAALSPQRVVTELIARTLDGSTRSSPAAAASARQGTLGRSAQSAALLADLAAGALARDPFGD